MFATSTARILRRSSPAAAIFAPSASRNFSSEVVVKGLSYYTTDEVFREMFSKYGEVKEVRLIRDARTRKIKGYGFVNYASQAEAQQAVTAMDGRILNGRMIFVEIARPKPQDRDTS